MLYHPLGAPWKNTQFLVRVFHEGGPPRLPVPDVARALGIRRSDLIFIMQKDRIPRLLNVGYSDGSINIVDLPQVFRNPLLELKWSQEEIDKALSYLERSKGCAEDDGHHNDPRAVELFNEWARSFSTGTDVANNLVFTKLNYENIHWALVKRECETLGELILLKTASLPVIHHLVKILGVNPTRHASRIIERCISWGDDALKWRFLLDFCEPRCKPEQLSGEFINSMGIVLQSPFFWSPLGRAIVMRQVRSVKFLLEYGCRLPLDESIPSWAWKIQEQVVKKKQCRNAVLALLGVGRRKRGPWRDLCSLFARALWLDCYNEKWSTLL